MELLKFIFEGDAAVIGFGVVAVGVVVVVVGVVVVFSAALVFAEGRVI